MAAHRSLPHPPPARLPPGRRCMRGSDRARSRDGDSPRRISPPKPPAGNGFSLHDASERARAFGRADRAPPSSGPAADAKGITCGRHGRGERSQQAGAEPARRLRPPARSPRRKAPLTPVNMACSVAHVKVRGSPRPAIRCSLSAVPPAHVAAVPPGSHGGRAHVLAARTREHQSGASSRRFRAGGSSRWPSSGR